MSRVFLAHETALGRRVVVKVLPPEMAAGVNQDRFRREIQLAAGLQHPHVVPVHSAGSSGDLLWYTMPLIEGDSLRTRLAKQGELPIKDTVQILREVADALSYAHSKGVVHRDIKPDNILISSRHALVTDFGVAKAVSEATGGQSLTSLGLALGTPSYMAPEQAAAEAHLDHRADIYAFGAMAYEMLTGRPPFTGMSAQAVLAAHITQTPEPVTTFRQAVPPALEGLVMRCLAKRPADRWQSADEITPHLEALLTPSGGTTPTTATAAAAPALTSGAEAALRRAHPVRVAMLFALAAVGALALVGWAVQQLGLPDWVFWGAVGLLALGLPITMVAGRHERQRVLQPTGPGAARPSGLLGRLTTLKGAALGGVVAFATLALGAGAFMVLRARGVGPFATLVTSGALEAQGRIVVADFENRTSDSLLGQSITEALRIDLSRSPIVRVMDATELGPALRRMQRDPGGALETQTALELAVREGIAAVIAGEIAPLGAGFSLSGRVLGADGATLLAERESAADESELISAVDRLSRKLREGIGESLKSIRAGEPLDEVTTHSLEALQAYSQSMRDQSRGDQGAMERHLKEALRYDSTFASAWRGLGTVYSNTQQPQALIRDAINRAYALRDRLPEIERLMTVATYATVVDYQPDVAIDAYQRIMAIRPDHRAASNNISILLTNAQRYGEAEAILRQHIARYPARASAYINLTAALALQGKRSEIDSAIALLAERVPGSPVIVQMEAASALAREDYGRAVQLADTLAGSEDEFRKYSAHLVRSDAFLGRGQLARARAERLAGAARLRAEGDGGGFLEDVLRQAVVDASVAGQPESARRLVDSALRLQPMDSLRPEDRPWLAMARYRYALGEVAEGDRALASFDRSMISGLTLADDPDRVAGEGRIAAGQTSEAFALFRKSMASPLCRRCAAPHLAHALDAAGQRDSAIAVYQLVLGRMDLGEIDMPLHTAVAHSRLGELYAQRGDVEQAKEHLGRFIELWRDADPVLQPRVAEARRRLSELTGEGR